ncbi:unnamed protein product [Leuciscus chuanchicus]
MSGSLVTRDEISQSPTPCSYAKTAEDIKSSTQDFQKLRPSREKEVKGFHCDVSDREIDRGKDGESGAKRSLGARTCLILTQEGKSLWSHREMPFQCLKSPTCHEPNLNHSSEKGAALSGEIRQLPVPRAAITLSYCRQRRDLVKAAWVEGEGGVKQFCSSCHAKTIIIGQNLVESEPQKQGSSYPKGYLSQQVLVLDQTPDGKNDLGSIKTLISQSRKPLPVPATPVLQSSSRLFHPSVFPSAPSCNRSL